jgi:hypothetical protein
MLPGRSPRRWIACNSRGKRSTVAPREVPRTGAVLERPHIERLESRILMAADPLSFIAGPNVAQDITLGLLDKAGVPTIQITDTATSTVIVEKAKADTSQVSITLSNLADRIRIKNDFTPIVPVTVDGRNGVDTLFGPSAGATFTITGANAGTGAGVTFTNISKVQGADNAANSFVLNAGAALSAGIDGGGGGLNALVGPSTGATFTVTGLDRGTVKEVGGATDTAFTNVAKLQGAQGADTFLLNAGAALTTAIDGGGGLNTLRGPLAGTTYTITGTDTGTAAGVTFSNIGKLQGANGAPDRFVLSAAASLTTGIDGGAVNGNTLIGPSTGATFNITGRDTGSVGSVAFTNIGRLQGADNAADTFVFAPGGSLTNGVDGGTGAQNTLVGPSTGATFTITRLDGGAVHESGSAFTTAFNNVGRLQGADTVSDTFIVNPAGSLTNGVDGGADGNDTLRLLGSVVTASYVATGPQSGHYDLDGRRVVFSGIETIEDNVVAQNRIVEGTASADVITISQVGTSITVSARTIDPITFQRPSVSLTVDGGGGLDSIAVASDLSLPSTALKLSSETITVLGKTINTTGATRGTVTFDSLGLVTSATGTVNDVSNGSASATTALISVANSTIQAGGAIYLTAASNFAGGLTAQAVAAFGLTEIATISISGSTFAANGLVNVAATTDADVTVLAMGNSAAARATSRCCVDESGSRAEVDLLMLPGSRSHRCTRLLTSCSISAAGIRNPAEVWVRSFVINEPET